MTVLNGIYEDELGGVRATCEGEEKCIPGFVEERWGKQTETNMEDIGVGGRIILKLILKE